jgi:hypothetical protein
MKDIYSKTIEVDKGVVMQVTEFIEDKLVVSIAYLNEDVYLKKELMITEGEAFALNSILNEWTKQREH